MLLGVRAVIAESFERIHRSNLVGMGLLPLDFLDGASRASLGLTGRETFTVRGLADFVPRQEVDVEVGREAGTPTTFRARVRIDGAAELDSFRNLGILRMVLRQLLRAED